MLHGLKSTIIEVEIDVTPGLPSFIIIGMPGQAVGEAKERITAALSNCGIKPNGLSLILLLQMYVKQVVRLSSLLRLDYCSYTASFHSFHKRLLYSENFHLLGK